MSRVSDLDALICLGKVGKKMGVKCMPTVSEGSD